MIVKLHEVRKDRPYPIYVNLDAIQYFAKSINGDDTRIKFAGDNIYLFVKESIEEIAGMMKPKPYSGMEWQPPAHMMNGAIK